MLLPWPMNIIIACLFLVENCRVQILKFFMPSPSGPATEQKTFQLLRAFKG